MKFLSYLKFVLLANLMKGRSNGISALATIHHRLVMPPPMSSYSIRRDVKTGIWTITRKAWPAAAAQRASVSLDPPTRPVLLAPSAEVWKRGEGLRNSESLYRILLSRDLKMGGERCDVALPGENDAFGEAIEEYVPLLFLAIETGRPATLRRLLELGVDPTSYMYFNGQPLMGAAACVSDQWSRCVYCTATAATSHFRG